MLVRRPRSSRLRLSIAVLVLAAFWFPLVGPGAPVAPGAPAAKPPNDPLFKYQWQLRAMQVPAAWGISTGAGAIVAVLDTGVAYENRGVYRRAPDLAGTRFVRGWDFVDGDAHPNDESPSVRQSHGSHVAGIIAQTTDNGIGAAGVAPKAAIMPIRVLRPDLNGSGRTIARGLRFAADHGADVANVSISGRSGNRTLEDAIAYASSKGVTVVAAAGNDGVPSVGFPAMYRRVIAVGAVDRDKSQAYYSNYGKTLDLVAPVGDGEDSGEGVLQQTLKGGPSTFCYCFMASTSAAAAEVSGVAALLVASRRATGPGEIRSALLSGAEDLGPPGRDREYGAGLVRARSALEAAGAAPAHRSTSVPAASGESWFVWLALGVAGAGLAFVGGLSLVRRHRRRAEAP